MSESSLPLTAPQGGLGTSRAPGSALLDSLAPLLTEWLPGQRWFAGKGRGLSGFSLVSATELLPCTGSADSADANGSGSSGGSGSLSGPAHGSPGLLHLLVRAHQPESGAEPSADASDQADDCYQLLLGVRPVLPPWLASALLGRPGSGPLRGRTVYDALADPRLTGVLLERLRSPGRLGPLRFARGSTAAIPDGLRPRPLNAEQSNSSVVYGSRYILKLFRRVGPGLNPDLELPLALARGGCDRVPAPTAWFEARPALDESSLTLGVLQPYLPGCGDGWELALRALDGRRDFTPAARALGRATAEVHAGLAASLPTAVLHGERLERLAAEMTGRLEAAARAVPVLRPYRPALRRAFGAVAGLARQGQSRVVQRVHGDLHLGQALRQAGDRWSLIDFEGEPARPLTERRRPQPTVRDVAGMLRSFDYAACQQGTDEQHVQSWANANRAAYCRGYAESSGTDPRDDALLLRAFETDKAVYEVLYEARHRPTWLPIPLSAVRRLAADA
ncbi:maltokinase N-terminal cap-like domain-containing protein [Streptomyces oceani]|uniref:Maltokinase n=1 Tax=Streptomyces oceani TaxID=1075402 RepID=A0A1E7KP26_9ACTN|nr:maltokinase [Streptomyces oceani]OEV05670.1 maltokinase [Streptomyces oceani]